VIAEGHPAPTVWEIDPARRSGAEGYRVIDPADDARSDYRVILDASGAQGQLDQWIGRLAKGGEVVLAGFYHNPVQFAFPPAFMREVRLRIAAEWAPQDLAATIVLIREGRLSLAGLITHHKAASQAEAAYRTAFSDSTCLKMVLDWSACA
jgi:3-hydroxyethyl bacteriochlorophyllide a dehydrogenase